MKIERLYQVRVSSMQDMTRPSTQDFVRALDALRQHGATDEEMKALSVHEIYDISEDKKEFLVQVAIASPAA
jgi:hypothetical protein